MFKKVAIFILAILFLAGCNANTPSPPGSLVATPNEISAGSDAPTQAAATPAPSLSPTPTISPMQEKFALAPELEGLNKEIREKDGIEKVVYLYEADNPYGGVEGEYAGEFKKDVFISGAYSNGETYEKDTGGLAMMPNVVGELVADADNPVRRIPFPVDISIIGDSLVRIYFSETLQGNYPYACPGSATKIEIEGSPTVNLICVSLEKNSIYRLFSDKYYGFRVENSYAASSEWADKRRDDKNIEKDEWSTFIEYLGDVGTNYFFNEENVNLNYGDVISNISSPIYLSMSYHDGITNVGSHFFGYQINEETAYPVFITANG
jgi:hypothetical protein